MKIQVWHIEPHPYDSSFDSAIERDYHRALSIAQDAIELLVDDASEEDLDNGKICQVKVWRTWMEEDEYNELTSPE